MIARSAVHLGILARERRQAIGWSQAYLADKANVSRQWVVAFEAGKATAEIGAIMRTVRALGLAFDLVELPPERFDLGTLLDE